MNTQRISRSALLGVVVIVAALLACKKKSDDGDQSKPTRAETDPVVAAQSFLAIRGIDASHVEKRGDDLYVFYEADRALEYDAQLSVEWGLVFGAFASAASGHVIIVNGVAGEPFVAVRAKSKDTRQLSAGKIDAREFFSRLELQILDQAS